MVVLSSFLIGTVAGADVGYESKDFRNAEGAHIAYDINADGYFVNGYFESRDIVFYFSGSEGTETIYTTNHGLKGIVQFKPYDGTVFDVELTHLENREAGVFASYRFNGKFEYSGTAKGPM